MLGQLNEKKSLIYFASGLRLNGLDNQAQLHATIDAAIRAGVSFWPIDARGLVAEAPLGDATQGSPGKHGMYSGAAALAVTTNLQQSQDTLYALAADTGGKALLDYNDLTKGIVQAEQAVSSYYIIGYYTTNTAQDGKFRRIKISLNEEIRRKSGLSPGLLCRQTVQQIHRRRQRTAAGRCVDAARSDHGTHHRHGDRLLPVESGRIFRPDMVKIPGRELALAKRGGAEHTLIDFIGEIKDDYGNTVTNVRDKVNIKLSDATAGELAKRPFEYDAGFTLLPGKYTIKFLARDDETGRIGTYQTTFVIPNLNKEEKTIPISSVVLSSQRIDLKDALYNAVKGKDKAEDGQSVGPRRAETDSQRDPGVQQEPRHVRLSSGLRAGCTQRSATSRVRGFYREQMKVLETQPIEVSSGLENRLKTMFLSFSVALHQLPPGEYDCQVTVLDPTGRRAAFWRAPITVVP